MARQVQFSGSQRATMECRLMLIVLRTGCCPVCPSTEAAECAGPAQDHDHGRERARLMSLTKLGLGIYLPVWGSDLPFRQHAQASRPFFLKGRCMPAVSLFFSQEPIRIPIAPRPRARLPRDRQLKNQWASDHCHTMAGGTPILAHDMTSIPITSTTAPRLRATSTSSWPQSIGLRCTGL